MDERNQTDKGAAPTGGGSAVAEKKPKPKRKAASGDRKPGGDRRRGRRSGGGRREGQGKRNRALGARGEEAAAHFLEQRGYTILERNWTCFAGEADIIAVRGGILAFIEVKTRRGNQKGFPAEAVSASKRERYERVALAYLQDHVPGETTVRFDIVSIVVLPEDRAFIRHHIAAFTGN